MEECELCGRQVPETYAVTIEGAELSVCARCAEKEGIVPKPKAAPRRFQTPKKEEAEEVLVDDYGERIRLARESMKIQINVMAEMINEKQSVLARVEQQKMTPPEALTKKIERYLNITLTETKAVDTGKYSKKKSDGFSIGDFITNK
jgi:putative transcription factor